MQAYRPGGPALAVAILYVIVGAVGILPGLFILLLLGTGIPFWYFVLRVGSTPVSFEVFLQGAQASLLETWPDFPFGIVGLALLAIHCVAAIPAAPKGLAVIRGSPAAERALRGLGVLYLFVFPVGTVLGLAALASMGRSSPPPVASEEPLTPSDRTLAAFCYAVPVLSAVYLFARGPTTRFVRVHAIQSSALFLVFYAVAKLTETLQPMTTFPIQALMGICLLLGLALLAFVTYGGRDLRLPLIGALAERTQEGFARGQQELQAAGALRMHQQNLAAAAPGPPPSVVTVIEGTRVANGFEQHIDKSADRPLLFVAGAFGIMLLLFLWGMWEKFKSGAGDGPVVMIVGALFFGSVIAFFIYLLVHKFLAGAAAEGRLLVRNWPLKPGADVRMQYKAKSRVGGKIESIDVALKCQEMIAWKDSKGAPRNMGLCIHDVVVPPIRAQLSPDGSVTAEWTLRVPREGPPSFTGKGGWIHWMLMVEMRIAGAPDSSQAFSMLVVAEMAT